MANSVDTATPAPAASDSPIGDAPSFLTPARLKMLGIGAAIVAVAAVVVWFVITSGQRKEAFAAQALEQARGTAEQGNIADAVQQFEKVVELYGGTSAAHEATLGMAQARLVAGQNELAISTLEEFLKANPPASYASPANGLLGTGYENVGRYDDAMAAYQRAAEEADISYLKATLLLDAGRSAMLAGKSDAARGIYEKIIADYGDTPARSEAEVRLAELTAKPA
ncbi:MAG TPA: tetratricopeptide repeat protein [Gemmatimonadales bacterium]|nr:tetratricopeptide repeat protein [Gemmatimonadales bacterium]